MPFGAPGMDVRASSPYVATRHAAAVRLIESAGLNFLLILSALLSALTGAFGVAREGEPRLHQAAAAVESAAAEAAEVAAEAVPAKTAPMAAMAAAAVEPLEAPVFDLARVAALETIRLLE